MATLDVTHDDILNAIQGVILDLNLPAIGDKVYVVRYPNELQVDFPAVFISVEGEAEQPDERMNNGTDWEYPTRVFFARQDTSNNRAHMRQELGWRQQLIDTFHMTTPFLNVMEDVYKCRVVPNVIYNPNLPAYQHIVSGMVIWSKIRIVRGTRVPATKRYAGATGVLVGKTGVLAGAT